MNLILTKKTLTIWRNAYTCNPMIGYLNVDSLRDKIISFRDITHKFPIDILCVDKTKLDESFPYLEFKQTYTATCFKSGKGSLSDASLTKKTNCFQKTHRFVTRISDCHYVTVTILRASFKKLLLQHVSLKKPLTKILFLHDLDKRWYKKNSTKFAAT